MRLKSLRVRNYRSISEEQSIDFAPGLTIVGPNNSGKTNILGAIRMLFTGFENSESYSRDRDFTFGKGREQTTLVAVFEADPSRDADHIEKYSKLLALYEPPRRNEGTEITIQLIFSTTGNPSYRLSSDTTSKLPRDQQPAHSRLIHELVDGITAGTSVHYVPSSNSSEQLFSELVSPLVKHAVSAKLSAEIKALKESVKHVSTELTNSVQQAGLENLSINLELPGTENGGFLSHFQFTLADPTPTAAINKGRGIQALAMLACFAWLARQENANGINSVWLIEEPESFLHPTLYRIAQDLLAEIEASGQVIRTTHALTMVPRDSNAIVGTKSDNNGHTTLRGYASIEEATQDLRGSLGVRFSDFFALGDENIFTEGESDIEFVRWAIDGPFAEEELPHLRGAVFRQFGGTTNLKGFLRANYGHIRPETAVVTLFDGDDAGKKAIQEIKSYLGQHGSGFEPNIDYVVGRTGHAVEGLFGDRLLTLMHDEYEVWFDSWDVDSSNVVFDYKLRDQSKRAAGEWLKDHSTEETADSWHPHWFATIQALENALAGWRMGRK